MQDCASPCCGPRCAFYCLVAEKKLPTLLSHSPCSTDMLLGLLLYCRRAVQRMPTCSPFTHPIPDQAATRSQSGNGSHSRVPKSPGSLFRASPTVLVPALPISAWTLPFHPFLFIFNSSLSAPTHTRCSEMHMRGRLRHSSVHASSARSEWLTVRALPATLSAIRWWLIVASAPPAPALR